MHFFLIYVAVNIRAVLL